MVTDVSIIGVPSRQTAFDYDRTVVAFHGTRRGVAQKLVDGVPFKRSQNEGDWLGHGVYFWEYGPQRAWWWAERRYGAEAAVVGAMIRLGRCVDLLDSGDVVLVKRAYERLVRTFESKGQRIPSNANTQKRLDCAVFNYLFDSLTRSGFEPETTRAVFVPQSSKGLQRAWSRSGVFDNSHIQISVRQPNNIVAVWHVRKDGRYGKDQWEEEQEKE